MAFFICDICCHTTFVQLFTSKKGVIAHSFGIDTGYFYANKLTALIIEDIKEPMLSYNIVQVSALKQYSTNKGIK